MSSEHATGLVLAVSSLIWLIGAGLPPEPTRVFSAGLEEHLAIVLRNRGRWRLMNSLMIAGMIGSAAGVTLFAVLLAGSSRMWAASVAYLVGAVLWIVALSFRDTVIPSAAASAAEVGEPPTWLPALQDWTGQLFWIHMLISYAVIAVIGSVLVSVNLLAAWVGWFALSYGLLLGISFVAEWPKSAWGPTAEPPFLIHIPMLIMGVALLLY